MGFAGFICCFHRALCSEIFCVAHAADTPIASVTLAVPEAAACFRHEQTCKAVFPSQCQTCHLSYLFISSKIGTASKLHKHGKCACSKAMIFMIRKLYWSQKSLYWMM